MDLFYKKYEYRQYCKRRENEVNILNDKLIYLQKKIHKKNNHIRKLNNKLKSEQIKVNKYENEYETLKRKYDYIENEYYKSTKYSKTKSLTYIGNDDQYSSEYSSYGSNSNSNSNINYSDISNDSDNNSTCTTYVKDSNDETQDNNDTCNNNNESSESNDDDNEGNICDEDEDELKLPKLVNNQLSTLQSPELKLSKKRRQSGNIITFNDNISEVSNVSSITLTMQQNNIYINNDLFQQNRSRNSDIELQITNDVDNHDSNTNPQLSITNHYDDLCSYLTDNSHPSTNDTNASDPINNISTPSSINHSSTTLSDYN